MLIISKTSSVAQKIGRVAAGNFKMVSPLAFNQVAHYTTIEEKGKAEENLRFRKEDERLLRQLLMKVKTQADQVDIHNAESAKAMELKEAKLRVVDECLPSILLLQEILKNHKVSNEELEKLLKWRHSL